VALLDGEPGGRRGGDVRGAREGTEGAAARGLRRAGRQASRSFVASEAQLVAAKRGSRRATTPRRASASNGSWRRAWTSIAASRACASPPVSSRRRSTSEALKVLDDNKDEAFVALVADLRGDIMLAQGRIDEARAAYKKASEKAEARNPVKGSPRPS
jgi:anti-sigma-K factor RskA